MIWRAVVAVIGLTIASLGSSPALAQSEEQVSTDARPEIAAPAAAELEQKPDLIPTEAFAGRSIFSGARFSPDGARMALRSTSKGKTYVLVLNAADRQPTHKFLAAEEDVELEWFRWAGNGKLILSVSKPGNYFEEEVLYTRLFAADLASNSVFYAGTKGNIVEGDDVIYVAEDGGYILLSVQRSPYDWPEVRRIPLSEKRDTKIVQKQKSGVWEWFADNEGVVRLGSGWRDRRLRIYYRSSADDKLELVEKLKREDERSKYWNVARINSGSDEGFVLTESDSGRVGLYKFNYSNGEVGDLVYENADWDLDRVSIGRDGQPLAAHYTADRRMTHWFDEDFKRWHEMLKKALPEEEVAIVSRAHNKSRMLVWGGGPADPGGMYILDSAAKKLDVFGDYRPAIRPESLARPKSVSYTARDGLKIPAYLTLPRGREAKNLPLIILPHGGPYGVRDKLRYDDEVQLLANRGYAVLQPNYRGSGGYGDNLFEKGKGQIGSAMQDDLDDAMDWAVSEGFADKNRVCMVGGSYGGYAALWAVIRNPERYRCAASWAGVTDWRNMLKYDRRYLSRSTNKRWRAEVLGENETKSLDAFSPMRKAATLSRPVLLAHGDKDSRVPFRQFKRMRDAAEDTGHLTLLHIEGEGHSFSKKENEKAWYDALVAFLDKHNPAD